MKNLEIPSELIKIIYAGVNMPSMKVEAIEFEITDKKLMVKVINEAHTTLFIIDCPLAVADEGIYKVPWFVKDLKTLSGMVKTGPVFINVDQGFTTVKSGNITKRFPHPIEFNTVEKIPNPPCKFRFSVTDSFLKDVKTGFEELTDLNEIRFYIEPDIIMVNGKDDNSVRGTDITYLAKDFEKFEFPEGAKSIWSGFEKRWVDALFTTKIKNSVATIKIDHQWPITMGQTFKIGDPEQEAKCLTIIAPCKYPDISHEQ